MAIHRGPVRRLGIVRIANKLKRRKRIGSTLAKKRTSKNVIDVASAETKHVQEDCKLPETMRRNIALEAVRTGNYWAPPEQQAEVLSFIQQEHARLLADRKWLKKYDNKLREPNGLTQRYTVEEVLAKRHEVDGFDVFISAGEAISAKQAAEALEAESSNITSGTWLVVKKDARVFKSTTSWDRVGMLTAGTQVEAAAAPTTINGFSMIPLKPEGAVEMKYLSIANAKDCSEAPSDIAQIDARSTSLDSLREDLAEIDSMDDPTDIYKLLHLMDGCAKAGEIGAAVHCGVRFEVILAQIKPSKMRGEHVNRAFEILKLMLRPGAATQTPKLEGPWSKPPPGRFGTPNHRKSLGQLLTRLSAIRKECESADCGEDAQRERDLSTAREKVLVDFCKALAPVLSGDATVTVAKRRGALCEAVERVCHEQAIEVSRNLAFAVVGELEKLGVVSCRGRDIEFDKQIANESRGELQLATCAKGLEVLESLAQERLERRQKRQKARQQVKLAKRRQIEEDE